MHIPDAIGDVPYLTTEQMIEVDRSMREDYKIDLLQMMENAGRSLAHLARARFLDGSASGKRVTVLAGTGGNGGGTMVCARHLFTYGATVTVCLSRAKDSFAVVPAQQLDTLHRMSVDVTTFDEIADLPGSDLIVDGIIGYNLRGAPRGIAGALIRWANRQDAPVLALDIPSGVDATSGVVYDPAIKANATMTLALPKVGLRSEGAADNVGELYLADLSVPSALYAGPRLGLNVGNIFAESDIVRLK
ncbi:MAG: hypothetical protein BMS9Abin05_1605 [Rhodothermia bacterium]|nr:MAG: hypothetical protein BMS9Abin05_1605 [Rhodothermia bacterium]